MNALAQTDNRRGGIARPRPRTGTARRPHRRLLASCAWACLVISVAVLAIGGDDNNSGGASLGFAGFVVAGFTFAPTTIAIGGTRTISSSIGTRTTSSSSLFLGPLPVAQDSADAYLAAGPPLSFAHSTSTSTTASSSQQRAMWNGAKEIDSFGASSSSSRGFFQQQLSSSSLSSSSPLSTTTTTTTTTALFLADASSSLESQDGGVTGSSGNEKETQTTTVVGGGTNKRNFFASLDTEETLNGATKERSALLAKMIDEKKVVPVLERRNKSLLATSTSTSTSVPTISYERPGSTETFFAAAAALNPKSNSNAAAADSIQGRDDDQAALVAVGTWKVIYAPHMTTATDIFRGRFDVSYELFPDSTMVSHAYYDFPIVGKGYLSVSGTYGSFGGDDSGTYSRVDFDKAWIKPLSSLTTKEVGDKAQVRADVDDTDVDVDVDVDVDNTPYASLEQVPDSLSKTIVNEIGKRAFIESVAVFPVSFLDDDTIVFEFEALGTKVCAHKLA